MLPASMNSSLHAVRLFGEGDSKKLFYQWIRSWLPLRKFYLSTWRVLWKRALKVDKLSLFPYHIIFNRLLSTKIYWYALPLLDRPSEVVVVDCFSPVPAKFTFPGNSHKKYRTRGDFDATIKENARQCLLAADMMICIVDLLRLLIPH